MIRQLLALAVVAWAGSALADDKPTIAPAGSWVRPIEYAPAAAPAKTDFARMLLLSGQTRFTPEGQEYYARAVVQILQPEALKFGTVTAEWDPATDVLVINHLHIIRNGTVIDALASGQPFTVIQREPDLDASMFYGRLTAVFQPDGVRIGDILDFAYTIKRRDAALAGHSESAIDLPIPFVPIDRIYFRAIWPAGIDMKWYETKGLEAPKVTHTADGGELVVDMKDLSLKDTAHVYPFGARIELSDYPHWQDVSRQFAPLYAKAETLAPDSPVKAEAAKIAAASSDPETRAAAALKLVQQDVRYVFKGENMGGFVPADADLTWRRRYGDCKGKSVLLVALLHELNIPAEVAAVSSSHGRDVADGLPGGLIFNHVIVRATIAGQVYWLDATHLHDDDIQLIGFPRFVSALPISDPGSDLESLYAPMPEKPLREYHIAYDASAGLTTAAPIHLDYVFRGEAARTEYRRFAKLDDAARQTALALSMPALIKRKIDVAKATFSYDRVTHEAREVLDGSTFMAWVADKATGLPAFAVDRSAVVSTTTYTPPVVAPAPLPPVVHPEPHSLTQSAWTALDPTPTAPQFAQSEPHVNVPPVIPPMPIYVPSSPSVSDWQYDRTIVTIALPRGGAGFTIDGADVDKTVIGHHYVRTSTLKDGVFTMDLTSRTTQREISASDELKARHDMTGFADEVKLKAPAGFRPSLAETEIRAKRSANTPPELRDRADARLDSGDFDGAMKDLDAALKLKADDVLTLNLRCFLKAEANRDLQAALADCDHAVLGSPTNAEFLDSRGLVHYRLGQFDLALKDYDAALTHDPRLASAHFMRGVVLRRLGRNTEGDADIIAGEKIDPSVTSDYARYGITP